MTRAAAILIAFAAALAAAAPRAGGMGVREVKPTPFELLSDRAVSALGKKALAYRAADWMHGESDHFIYHFFDESVVNQATIEAEYYYRVIASDLRKETARWERKCHLFLFDRKEDWAEFRGQAALDPWTGGIHAGGELFVFRDRSAKWKGHILGHEIAHLVVFRFFGNGVPLWLNEGYAEEVSIRGYAAYFRARGYIAKPVADSVDPARYMPLAEFVEAKDYPPDAASVWAFYRQSQRLVRFLDKSGKEKFIGFFSALAEGARFETALREAYGARHRGVPQLDDEFKTYASEGFERLIGGSGPRKDAAGGGGR
jgi:hypothetical protein